LNLQEALQNLRQKNLCPPFQMDDWSPESTVTQHSFISCDVSMPGLQPEGTGRLLHPKFKKICLAVRYNNKLNSSAGRTMQIQIVNDFSGLAADKCSFTPSFCRGSFHSLCFFPIRRLLFCRGSFHSLCFFPIRRLLLRDGSTRHVC